jgi:hypothetical protein
MGRLIVIVWGSLVLGIERRLLPGVDARLILLGWSFNPIESGGEHVGNGLKMRKDLQGKSNLHIASKCKQDIAIPHESLLEQ